MCSDIVLLNGKKLAYYKAPLLRGIVSAHVSHGSSRLFSLDLANMQGDYDAYVQTVKETRLAQQRAYDAQQKEISHILEFINKHDERPKIVAQKAGNFCSCAILAAMPSEILESI